MMGNIGLLPNFDVKIGHFQKCFFMIGNSKLGWKFTVNVEWAIGKGMAQQ